MRFLIVEDEKIIMEILVHCLSAMFKQAAGFQIITCDTIKCARDYYVTHDPHIVVLDLTLIDSSQENTITQIPFFNLRADVVVVTGDDSPRTRERCFEQGANDYLDKRQIVSRSLGEQFTLMRMTSRFVAAYLRSCRKKK